ncbi:MAG TPA: hypothetical protein VMI11_14065 [Actinomycetes bacterium]|nr:hypothetical protein [Actinomycetes bacterium]
MGMSRQELLALPAVVSPDPVAFKAFDMSRGKGYELLKTGTFPCKVIRIGVSYKVVTGGPDGLLAALGIEPAAGS